MIKSDVAHFVRSRRSGALVSISIPVGRCVVGKVLLVLLQAGGGCDKSGLMLDSTQLHPHRDFDLVGNHTAGGWLGSRFFFFR